MLGSYDRNTSEASRIEPRFQNAPLVAYDDSSWDKINLPHTWNVHDPSDEVSGYWRGIGWYRKHFGLSPDLSGKRLVLEFEGANQVSEVWVNGVRLGIHRGGYTGFEWDITSVARFGPPGNVVTVKVDNLYRDQIPPTVKSDYTFYGGIYRDVWLRATNPTFVSAVSWTTPSVSERKASLQLHSVVRNESKAARQLTLVHEILDPGRKVVATLAGAVPAAAGATVKLDQSVEIESPLLWSPDTPNLYQIRSILKEGERILDVNEEPLGFRWFRFDAQKGFFLNGKRVQIQGVNWHQSYPGMGNALPNSRHWKDMEVIREMGCNFWRTSHYPHDPATLEASDKLGLLVWEELPINKEIGHPDEYIQNVVQMAREMIERDRNHPSIILWGIAGEVNAPRAIMHRVMKTTADTYRSLDPTRPVVMHEPRGEDIETLVDVVGSGAGRATDEKHARFPNRPYMTGEYSAAIFGRAIYGGGPASEERACERHEMALRQINRRPWMAGGAIWNAFDYDGESYDPIVPHMVSFGMTDVWRIPKEPYYFYQSQWSSKPMVHIVGHWTWPGQEGSRRPVKVYSNAPEVELFLNGRSLGVKNGVPGNDLQHPPLMWEVEYQPGTLRAVARFAARKLADERKTAGLPAQIVLVSDAAEVKSGDLESLAYLTAAVTDKAGTVVPNAATPITFTWFGPGELLPQTWPGHGASLTWNAVGGLTRVTFRPTSRTGTSVISAYSPGLAMGRTSIKVTAPGRPDEMQYKERFEEDETPITGELKE